MFDRLTSTATPEGKTTSYAYDANSNVLTATVTPKPGSSLTAQTTTVAYDALYNKPTRVTDPLGLRITELR